jgi:hypothetical protein
MLIDAIKMLLPSMQQLLVNVNVETSEYSLLLTKQILEVYYALIHYLPLPKPIPTEWVNVIQVIADRPFPPAIFQLDEVERVNLPSWKCNQLAMAILNSHVDESEDVVFQFVSENLRGEQAAEEFVNASNYVVPALFPELNLQMPEIPEYLDTPGCFNFRVQYGTVLSEGDHWAVSFLLLTFHDLW